MDIIYRNGKIRNTNKPEIFERKTAIAIDHVLINYFVKSSFKKQLLSKLIFQAIFPICLLIPSTKPKTTKKKKQNFLHVFKRFVNTSLINASKQKFHETN